jgi:hypothetical protein
MLLTFYIRESFHYKFVPTGQTVNQVYYMDVLERLRERFRWKSPDIFANNSRILHHDNAPAHTALPLREVLATKKITVLVHPAYSTDLAPNDFFLFPKVTKILKGRHFDDTDDIRDNTTAQNQFQNCSEVWTRRWHQCTASQGSTLKANTVVFSIEVRSNFTAMEFAKFFVRPRKSRSSK